MQKPPRRRPVARAAAWDAGAVRALRRHMKLSQDELAAALGTRQQTISEWETGLYQPRGLSERLLSLVAERAAFAYDASPQETTGETQGERE